MQSELEKKETTEYLKAKDLENKKQLQNELNTMIKQEFGKTSKYKEVHNLTAALIKLGQYNAINWHFVKILWGGSNEHKLADTI